MASTANEFEDAIGKPFPEGNTRKIRIAVVGLDAHGADYEFHLHPNCTVVAVAEPVQELRRKLHERYACDTGYGSLEALLEGEKNLDAVAIFTGIPERFHDSMRCMERGLHVLTEVPACGTLEEAAKLIEIKERTGMRYMLAEPTWFFPDVIYARYLFRRGDLGEVYYIESEYNAGDIDTAIADKSSHLLYNVDGSRTWRWGFSLFRYPTHALTYVTGITGDSVASVSAYGWGNGTHPYITNNDYGNPFVNETALFELDHDHMARCNGFYLTASSANRASLYGDRASYHAPRPGVHGSVLRCRPDDPPGAGEGGPVEIPEVFGNSRFFPPSMRRPQNPSPAAFITAEFINALLEDREPQLDVYTAVAMTVPGLVAHESARKGGERLEVPRFARPRPDAK